jgi:hypothetical protein
MEGEEKIRVSIKPYVLVRSTCGHTCIVLIYLKVHVL